MNHNNGQQPPQYAQQQQQQHQQAPHGAPPQYAQPPQYGQPPQQQQQQARPAAQQPGGGMPDIIMPDASTLAHSHRQAEDDQVGRPNYFKVQPPVGRVDWASAAVGMSAATKIWFCPPYESGRPIDHLQYSHFVKSHSFPKGTRIRCDDAASCVLCQTYKTCEDTVSKAVFEQRLRFFRRIKERLYNVLNLDNEATMQMQDGTMRPLLANFAAQQTHLSITGTIAQIGPNIVHPVHGRPWRVTRTKTGTQMMNVQTSVEVMDPEPLPQHLWALLSPNNLWPLHKVIREVSQQDKEQMVRDLGFASQGQTSYPGPATYGAPQAQQQQPPQQASWHQQPDPHAQSWGGPPPQQQQQAAPPQGLPPQPTDAEMFQMPAWDSSPPPQGGPPPAPSYGAPAGGPQPTFQPAPGVTYAPTAHAGSAHGGAPVAGDIHAMQQQQAPAAAAPAQDGQAAELARLQAQLAALQSGKPA